MHVSNRSMEAVPPEDSGLDQHLRSMQTQTWHLGKPNINGKGRKNHEALSLAVQTASQHTPWQWPDKPVIFLTDPHADTEAFHNSLALSGAIRQTGIDQGQYRLTRSGREARIIIGGDCLDKGPSNLQLLRAIRNFSDKGGHAKILAGNHDMRLLMGLQALNGQRKTGNEHFFMRMMPKAVPLLKEIHDGYIQGQGSLSHIPGVNECRRQLYPSEQWFEEFPRKFLGVLPQDAIDKELHKIKKKTERFEKNCDDAGLCMRSIYASVDKCRALFMKKTGEFSWFFRHMELAHREGSFLFVHAGLDDHVAHLIRDKGIKHLNREFRKRMRSNLSAFYYGPLANTLRTKYRDNDRPLSSESVVQLHRHGIHAIAHGHRNRLSGQRLMLRQGLLHIESDITLDRHSRKKEGLEGIGAGVTIVHPEGKVIGISTDYPYAKVFEPHIHLQ